LEELKIATKEKIVKNHEKKNKKEKKNGKRRRE
jgi:hypothetical protein